MMFTIQQKFKLRDTALYDTLNLYSGYKKYSGHKKVYL